jgi:small neutral amino acid transporter SnatA (MarC family)
MILPGIVIGFYGYLFPGNINLMVLELFRSKQYKRLVLALAMIVLFESMYASISLIFLNEFNSNTILFKKLELAAGILILILGLWMIVENKNNQKAIHNNTLYRGIISIIIHPQQIPFWIIAGIFIKKVLQNNLNNRDIIGLVIGNGIGTILIMVFYMIFGNKILNYFKLNIANINKVMGAVYILLAVYGLFVS